MKRIGLKVSSTLAAALLVVLAMAQPSGSIAQVAGTASIHGHVNNPVGQAITNGEVRLSTDRSSSAAATARPCPDFAHRPDPAGSAPL